MTDYKFYNEKQKERFLKTIDKTQYDNYYWERLFTKTGERESKLNKDICDFTAQELIEIFKYLDSASYELLNIVKLNIEKYILWCLDNTIIKDGQNHLVEISNISLMSCVNNAQIQRKIIPINEFKKIVSSIENDIDKYVLYALYEGITGKGLLEMAHLKLSDIDKDQKTARLSDDRAIPVSEDFIKICELADKQTIYYAKNGSKIELISNCNRIYKHKKGSNNADEMVQSIVVKYLQRIKSSYYLSAKSIEVSGMINMIKNLENENNCNAEQVLYNKDLFKCIYNKYRLNPATRRRFLLKYNMFL